MSQYSMKPIDNGTRLRTDHSTFASVITSYNRGQLIVGDEVWEALSDGAEVRKGDKWLHVTHVDGVPVQQKGWMAYIHKGVFICNNFLVIEDTPNPEPEEPIFPQSFVLTDPNGASAEYVFVRILE